MGRARGETAILRGREMCYSARVVQWDAERAISSAGEHYLDMVGVTGSIPVSPTIRAGTDGISPMAKKSPQSQKVAVVGTGYVGMSLAVLLARANDVVALDVDAARVAQIAAGESPIADAEIQAFLRDTPDALRATCDREAAYAEADFIIVATPTDYDPESASFDTRSVEAVVADVLGMNETACVVIKSTVPVGFTDGLRARFETERVIFSPEFLREGNALYDNRHPSRIVVGGVSPKAAAFAELLRAGAESDDVPVLFMSCSEAEAVKLFANAYLAMRVAFFNELDSYALMQGMETESVIEGVSLDPRIGGHYNNPSFGYGGYCLPKDTQQLLAAYARVPQNLIRAIVESNATRKRFIAEQILARKPEIVGVYRLTMKAGADNFRTSSVQDVMRHLHEHGVKICIYEPLASAGDFPDFEVVADVAAFKKRSDVIIANRGAADLEDVADKVFTRDRFGSD